MDRVLVSDRIAILQGLPHQGTFLSTAASVCFSFIQRAHMAGCGWPDPARKFRAAAVVSKVPSSCSRELQLHRRAEVGQLLGGGGERLREVKRFGQSHGVIELTYKLRGHSGVMLPLSVPHGAC